MKRGRTLSNRVMDEIKLYPHRAIGWGYGRVWQCINTTHVCANEVLMPPSYEIDQYQYMIMFFSYICFHFVCLTSGQGVHWNINMIFELMHLTWRYIWYDSMIRCVQCVKRVEQNYIIAKIIVFNISVVISVMVTFFYTFYSYSHAFHTTHSLRMSRYSLYEKRLKTGIFVHKMDHLVCFVQSLEQKIETLF